MDNLQPIQINITTSGGEEAVKTINSVARALKNLQVVQKSVSNVMTNFGNTKINNKQTLNLLQMNDSIIDASKSTNNLAVVTDSYNKAIIKKNKTTKEATNNFKNMARSGFKLFGSLYSLNKTVRYLSQAFNESASWVENLNVMEVAFGDLSDEAYQFTKSVAGNFGLDANQILQYVSLFQQMASAMGQSAETAYKMSTALTLLGTDVASLYNKDVAVTMEALRSAIAGQVKPVRQFGFDITSYSIDGLIEQMGILEGYTSRMMTQSQKQLARTILLIQQSKNAWGDLGKTLGTYSNQQKILQSQFVNLKRAVGDLFIGTMNEAGESTGIATQILYRLNGVLMALVETIRAFLPAASSSGFESIQKEAQDTQDEIEGVEDAINGTLLSFDKFNTLSQSEGKGNEWITSELEKLLGDEYEAYLEQWNARMENVSSKAHQIRDSIMEWLGFTKEINTYTQTIGEGEEAIQIEMSDVNFSLKEGYSNIKLIGVALAGILATMTAIKALKTFSDISSVVDVVRGVTSISDSGLTKGWSLLAQSLISIQNSFLTIGIRGAVIGATLTAIAGALVYLYNTNEEFRNSVNGLLNSLKNLLNSILTPIMQIISDLGTSMSSLVTNVLSIIAKLLESIAPILTIIVDLLNELVSKLVNPIVTAVSKLVSFRLTNLLDGVAIALNVIFDVLKLMFGWIEKITSGIQKLYNFNKNPFSISAYANGGYPDRGSLFIANERGPELVGNIGGRTSVANNDMIVQAIENASYRGMAMAMANSGGTNNVNLKINANSNDLSRALARSMVIELRRQGYNI